MMHRLFLAWGCMAVLCCRSSALSAQPLLPDTTLGLEGVSSERIFSLHHAALAGNAEAQYMYGVALFYGHGVTAKPHEATQWFRKAADQGHALAAGNLGMILQQAGSSAAAKAWLKAAADAGSAEAAWRYGELLYHEGSKTAGSPLHVQARAVFREAGEGGAGQGWHYLGLMQEYGLGGPADWAGAAEAYAKAARLGHAESLYHLGLLKAYGRGVEQSHEAAAALFSQAVEQHGHGGSQYFLGTMHLHGQGVQLDYSAALRLFSAAAASGHHMAGQAASAAAELRAFLDEADATMKQSTARVAWGADKAKLQVLQDAGSVVVQGEAGAFLVPAAQAAGSDSAAMREAAQAALRGQQRLAQAMATGKKERSGASG